MYIRYDTGRTKDPSIYINVTERVYNKGCDMYNILLKEKKKKIEKKTKNQATGSIDKSLQVFNVVENNKHTGI